LGTSTEGVYLPGNYLKIGASYTNKGHNGYALDVDGSANFTGNVEVQKNVTVDGSLNVLGYSYFTNSINMNNQNITGVNNIALTTINGAAYPPVTGAGTIVHGANPSAAVALVFNVITTIDSITLPAGVWNIQMDVKATIAATTEIGYLLQYLYNGSSSVLSVNTLVGESPAQSGALTYGYSNSQVVVLTATSTTLTLKLQLYYSHGSVTIYNPATASTQYLTATRIA